MREFLFLLSFVIIYGIMITIIDYFEKLETENGHDGYFFSAAEAAVIVILGLLCGLDSVKKIHQWAADGRTADFLRGHFGIEKVPSYYWLLCLLKMIKPESLSRCFTEWVSDMPGVTGGRLTIALDGKTVRSTAKGNCKKSPLHIVSAHIAEMGLTLAQKAVDGKSNEIPAVQELLRELEIGGCMVVADAMHCQKKTAEEIIKKNADYLLDAKDNQRTLKGAIREYVDDGSLRAGMDRAETHEKSRERIERRTAYCTDDVSWLPQRREWAGLKSIGAIRSAVRTERGASEEWHYYISSRRLSAGELLSHARKEWSVETMHWLLDVHYKEDDCRVLDRDAQQNLNILRKSALNIIRSYKKKSGDKRALSNIMFDNLLNMDSLLSIVSES